MKLSHNKITIRNATVEDAELLSSWWNDGKVMAHAGFPNGLGTTAEKVATDIAKQKDETGRTCIISYDGSDIGEMSYRNSGDSTAVIGIKICDGRKQNQGLGKQILSLFISALFSEYSYKKITLDTNLNNLRAQHVYEELGFRKTGVEIDSWKDQLGRLQSVVFYELLPCYFISFI